VSKNRGASVQDCKPDPSYSHGGVSVYEKAKRKNDRVRCGGGRCLNRITLIQQEVECLYYVTRMRDRAENKRKQEGNSRKINKMDKRKLMRDVSMDRERSVTWKRFRTGERTAQHRGRLGAVVTNFLGGRISEGRSKKDKWPLESLVKEVVKGL